MLCVESDNALTIAGQGSQGRFEAQAGVPATHRSNLITDRRSTARPPGAERPGRSHRQAMAQPREVGSPSAMPNALAVEDLAVGPDRTRRSGVVRGAGRQHARRDRPRRLRQDHAVPAAGWQPALTRAPCGGRRASGSGTCPGGSTSTVSSASRPRPPVPSGRRSPTSSRRPRCRSSGAPSRRAARYSRARDRTRRAQLTVCGGPARSITGPMRWSARRSRSPRPRRQWPPAASAGRRRSPAPASAPRRR